MGADQQTFSVLPAVRTVDVMGDGRTYDHVLGLRAVTSVDGVKADLKPSTWCSSAASRIINEVRGVNRVVYDVTNKLPGIE